MIFLNLNIVRILFNMPKILYYMFLIMKVLFLTIYLLNIEHLLHFQGINQEINYNFRIYL